ncbi:hypothetical protein BC835DRAFT_1504792 [Cytidiella melzeri]|nr:hypothetical protein BC835DRAFT_1504792 [Cytidiella melzeri]
MDGRQRYDPRLGDESVYDSEAEEVHVHPNGTSPLRPNSSQHRHPERGRSKSRRPEKHVRLDVEPSQTRAGEGRGEDVDLERGTSDATAAEDIPQCEECIGSRADKQEAHANDSDDSKPKPTTRTQRLSRAGMALVRKIPLLGSVDLSWVSNNLTWSKIKPALRCALLAWVSLLFVVIAKLEVMLGQASFLILIAAILMPPSAPFIAVLEQEILLMILVTISWAWSCLGLFLANLTRVNVVPAASLSDIRSGQYLETAPSVIQSLFLFFGSTFFLYLKGKRGPGPFFLPTILACICLDVCLCTAALWPYAFYDIGKLVVIPLALHSALAIFFAATFFPSTVTAQYTASIRAVLDPISTFLDEHRKILQMDPSSEEFSAAVGAVGGLLNKSEGGLATAATWYRLLERDIVWGRFAPADVGGLHWSVRRIVTRGNGMNVFFTLIEPTREKWPQTPAPSGPGTPVRSRAASPTASSRNSFMQPQNAEDENNSIALTNLRRSKVPSKPSSVRLERHDTNDSAARRRLTGHRDADGTMSPLHLTSTRHFHDLFHRHRQTRVRSPDHDDHMHLSLLQMAHSLSFPSMPFFDHHFQGGGSESTVGMFESQRYLALESTRLSSNESPELTNHFVKLLGEACDGMLEESQKGLEQIKVWLAGVRAGRWESKGQVEKRRKETLDCLDGVKSELDAEIDRFRKDTRLRVLDPYRVAFDPKHQHGSEAAFEAPPHKYLFHCYMYEFHTLQLATLISGALGDIINLEKERKEAKLWITSTFLLWWRTSWSGSMYTDPADDEDPDVVQYMDPEGGDYPDLGVTKSRDPDALPPSNLFELVMLWLYKGFAALGGGNVVFAVKAGLLTVALSLPYHFKSSAAFAYEQHLTWAIFIGQFTIARFRGDTTFGFIARIVSTFFGGLLGTVLWYISAGDGKGNAYGLAAVTAVSFPFVFYALLYWPITPTSKVIFFVTATVIIGFSWQDAHFPAGFIYFGINVSWRRFVLVTAGVTAAFLASFLPPAVTLRRYQRHMMSTTVAELGSVYCAVLSFANIQGAHEVDKGTIIQSLIDIRMKLKRSLVLRTNIVYEISLRGRWPADRYQRISEIQLQVAYLLAHLMSVVERLEPAWRRAFLRRTRFMDADFQGDVLAVISMISTSLRAGHPLPQITPCPLLDRYMQNQHGLNVIRHEADDDYGLPRTMTLDTLANEQYMCFSVGCTTAFGIVQRLDSLMLATKELVGEQYHIHGVGLTSYGAFTHTAGTSNLNRPAKDL